MQRPGDNGMLDIAVLISLGFVMGFLVGIPTKSDYEEDDQL